MLFKLAFKTTIGISLVSMISMEATMNLTDFILTGDAILSWSIIPFMLLQALLILYE